MTHLKIENQNSNVEIVNAAIILKLYEMALSAEGDVSLKGNLLSDHAKLSAYDYLTGNLPDSNNKRFPNLTINLTDGAYIDFESPATEKILSEKIGDGIGITTQLALALTSLPSGLLTIEDFRDLKLFTNVNTLINAQFGNTVNNPNTTLKYIDLKNITILGNANQGGGTSGGPFEGCTSLSYIGDTSNITHIGTYAFRSCSAFDSTKWYIFNSVLQIGVNYLRSSGIRKMVFGDLLNKITSNSIYYDNNVGGTCVILATTPPLVTDGFTQTGGTLYVFTRKIKYYVPDEAYNDYCTDSEWGKLVSSEFLGSNPSNLFKISDLSDSYKLQLQEAGVLATTEP